MLSATRLEPIKDNLPGFSGWNRLYPMGKHRMVSYSMQASLFKYLLESFVAIEMQTHRLYSLFSCCCGKTPNATVEERMGLLWLMVWGDPVHYGWKSTVVAMGAREHSLPLLSVRKQKEENAGVELAFFYCSYWVQGPRHALAWISSDSKCHQVDTED